MSNIKGFFSKGLLIGLLVSGGAVAKHPAPDVAPSSIDYDLFVEEVVQGLAVKTQRKELFVIKKWRTMEPKEQILFLQGMVKMKNMCRLKAMFAHMSAIEAHTETQEQMLSNLEEVVVPQVRDGSVPHHLYVDFQRIVRDAYRRQPDPIAFGYENLNGCVRHGF